MCGPARENKQGQEQNGHLSGRKHITASPNENESLNVETSNCFQYIQDWKVQGVYEQKILMRTFAHKRKNSNRRLQKITYWQV
jgi:hypothetical protein